MRPERDHGHDVRSELGDLTEGMGSDYNLGIWLHS
jgi:hypothetical protein